MNDAYIQGFIDACNSRGYDAEKVAATTSTKVIPSESQATLPSTVQRPQATSLAPSKILQDNARPVPRSNVDPKTLVPVKKK